ncbi:MAG: hypothetical protein ACM3QS_13380 [Bacteroidota bacterium]
MLAPLIHILPLATVVRQRVLPIPGTVHARLNQKVVPTEVVAQGTWAREHLMIDVAGILHIAPSAADRVIRCQTGDRLPEGAEVAVGGGLFPRRIHTPREGRVVTVGGGQILLETGESPIQLRAGMPGTVIELIRDRGVVIQNAGSLIQGIWGNGRIDTGVLVNLAEKPDAVLSAGRLDVAQRGAMILAGRAEDAEFLQAAAELPVRGLILSSLSPALIPLAGQMRYPILVTDGLGSLPMNSLAYRLLSTNVQREVTLNAEAYDRYTGARPEVFIPLPVSQEPATPRDVEEFAQGQIVRMRRPPAMGAIGSIMALRTGQTLLPSGLHAPAADVKLESGETVLVPLVNLEVVG